MMSKRALTISVFLLFSSAALRAAGTPLLAGYIQAVPAEIADSISSKKADVVKPGGIKTSYCGYIDFTNNDGYFKFPIHHTNNVLRVIVCSEIDYDTMQNTVSKIELKRAQQNLKVSQYRITKQKDAATSPSDKDKADAKEQKPQDSWCFLVEKIADTPPAPEEGITANDLIIFCNPDDLYVKHKPAPAEEAKAKEEKKSGALFYTEESPHFILPTDCFYLLKTQAPATIDENDKFTIAIDATSESDSVANKDANATDSMGNTLPGTDRQALATD